MSTRTTHPIFAEYSPDDIAAAAGYSAMYVMQVREGVTALTPRFRRVCVAVLGRPESELFLSEEAEAAAREGTA